MFTDWTMTDPHYFYIRGVILGVVLTITIGIALYGLIKNK